MEGAGARHGDWHGLLASRLSGALFEHVDQGGHEGRVSGDSVSALVWDPQALGCLLRLGVEVVNDLHVVADEADGDDHDAARCRDIRCGVAGNLLEEIVDIGLEPAGLRGSRPRAIHEVVAQIRAPKDTPQLGHDRLDEGVMLGDVADFGCRGSRFRRRRTPLLVDAIARGRRGLAS